MLADRSRAPIAEIALGTDILDKPPALPMDRDILIASARDASEFLKALSHETRLLILCLLVEGEKSVSELEAMLALRQPAVSQQLARLRADNLVETRRDGKNVYYRLTRPELIEIIGVLHKTFCPPMEG